MSANDRSRSAYAFDRSIALIAAIIIVGMALFLLIRNQEVDPSLRSTLRVLMALCAGVFGSTFPGYFNLKWSGKGLVFRASDAFALSILVYLFEPGMMSNAHKDQPSVNQSSTGPQSPPIINNSGNIVIKDMLRRD